MATKVFLSTQFKDKTDEEIRARFGEMIRVWRMTYPDDEFEFVENLTEDEKEKQERLANPDNKVWCLGRAIQKLGGCDAIFLDKNWDDSSGCYIERDVAAMYGIKIYDWASVRKFYLERCKELFG